MSHLKENTEGLIYKTQSGLIIENQKRKVIYVNKEFCKMFSITSHPEVLIGNNLNVIIEQLKLLLINNEEFIKQINKIFDTNETLNINELLLKDGRTIEYEFMPFKIEPDKVQYLWLFRDISFRKKILKDLSESEERFRTLTEFSPNGIFLDDPQGKAIYINSRCAELVGVPSELALSYDWVPLIHPDDRKRVTKEWGNAVSNGVPFKEEYRWVHPDGKVVWTRGEIAPVKDSNGNILLFIGSLVDISIRKQAEMELQDALIKAQESERLKSAFLANMSHEIRTPMNSILGFIDLLKKRKYTNEKKHSFLRIIEESGNRMLNTLNDIIDISRIEAGLVKVDKTKVSINKICKDLLNMFSLEAELKGLKLSCHLALSEKESFIITDQPKLESILTNLIKNAIKFTDQGSIRFGYILKKENEHKEIEFYVSDTGLGISSDQTNSIFNRFEQAETQDSKVYDGSGLGLAISKSYTEMLGGNIHVSSEEGKGSTFTFTLPHHKGNAKKNNSNLININTNLKIRDLNLIIAEDDNVNKLLFREIIDSKRNNVIYTSTGKETIEVVKKNPETDVILMDIKMPEINGLDATKEIRKFNKDVIIIAQTAFAMAADKKKSMEAGFNDYLVKPLKKEILIGTIIKHLNLRA